MASPKTQRKKGTQRKLAAILCADVQGYSRLMGANEEATIETLTAYRKVFTSKIKKFRGREMSRIPHEIARRVGRPTSVAGVQ